MSISPVPNRSFLHGDRKPFPTSEKIVYATLDSLALKRARLPLQLLPDDGNKLVAVGTAKSKKKKNTVAETTARKFSSKVDETTNPSSQQTTTPNRKERETTTTEKGLDFVVEQKVRRKIASPLRVDTDNSIDNASIKVVKDDPTDQNSINSGNDENVPSFDDSGRENKICRVNRAETKSSSDDYEKIELTPQIFVSVREETIKERIDHDEYYSEGVFLKSKSAMDLTRNSLSDIGLHTVEEFPERDSLKGSPVSNDDVALSKKKKHFAKNVLYFVPDYLVKGTKGTKKKKKSNLSASLTSLKSRSVDAKSEINFGSRYKSMNLSKKELKCLNISTPTNFVHVASATNPSLVLNENTVGFGLEQVVIRHEEKCATLPLLVGRNEDPTTESLIEQRSIVAEKMPFHDASNHGKGSMGLDDANLRREFLRELRARSAKALELSQQVKTSENQAVASQGKIYELSPRANPSFLWSSQTKSLLQNTRLEDQSSTAGDSAEIVDEQEYDDVGPLKFSNQIPSQEDVYDDVGSPMARVDEDCTDESTSKCSDCIYDDIMAVGDAIEGPVSHLQQHESSMFTDNVSWSKNTARKGNGEIRGDESSQMDGHYLFVTNEYSSVDEDTDEMQDDEQGVYDDVGLPSMEKVNSLYAGSTTGSIVGKESEWEDVEDSTIGRSCLARRNNPSKSTEMQAISSKKKAGQRWSRKVRRQRSMASRKSWKSLTKPIRDSAYCDNVSDDTTYESLCSFQSDEFSSGLESDSETETIDGEDRRTTCVVAKVPNETRNACLEAPTKPNPPPPREASLTQTLGRRMKMLRRTWSITKGSLSRMRRRTSVDDDHSCEEIKETCNDHPTIDAGRYFGFARHFKKSVSGFSTFYLNGYTANGSNDSTRSSDDQSNKESTYSNSNRKVDHYSVLADQEPLYQFYAAAAARVAFDSNSDGYEEVEDTIPSQATTDLARPGHRTLWCQTPQVIGSGLLQRLSSEERKIQEAKFEILTSEASYLNSLRVLENEFLGEFSMNETLTSVEREKLFGGIPAVLQASEQFLTELETLWRQDPMLHGLADVLLNYADRFLDIYVSYCTNQVSIDMTLKDLRTRKGVKFLETVAQIEARPICQNLSLHSFLMLPMQRITRLPLLADAVVSRLPIEHADRRHWETVLTSLSYVVAECNEGARAAATEAEMECLTRKLEYSVKITPIALKDKHLVKSGPVVQLLTKSDSEYKLTFGKKFNKTPLYLLLLTDYLLVAKYKPNTHNETYTVIDTCKRSLVTLESVPEDSPFAGRNAMLLTLLENYSGRQVEYILTCESNTERQRWLEAVSPSNQGLVGETLYEVWDCPQVVALYSYSPNQPDELSLHPGDVINVLQKMSDGWFHGKKLLDGDQGWFPGNYTKEVASEHVRARNLKQRHRLLALSSSGLHRKAKQQAAGY
ncbi:ephexin isoform X2 [Colletes latitarsis]|uniref:ephexin isoform X2 n=1 Tax=Colletes latitarsis TaxID=2605962 RepID=UPI004035C2F3